jgi:hypothetical protein
MISDAVNMFISLRIRKFVRVITVSEYSPKYYGNLRN